MERRQVGAGPLSSNLLSQVTDPPKIVKADFTMLSENPRAGRESLTNLPPMENFGRPTILLPGHLDYHLSGAYIGISIHLRCLWDFGKRQIRPHTRTPEQSSRRTAQTFQSQLPWKQPFAVRCSTLFQGVGTLTATRGRGETNIVLQISSSDICLLENI